MSSNDDRLSGRRAMFKKHFSTGPSRHGTYLALACVALASTADLKAQSSRPGWGSTPYHAAGQTGVTFRVWAPNATSVTVPGQFNSWSTIATPLAKELTNGVWNAVWSADVPIASPGQQYKYFLNGNLWKRDPRARKCVNSADNSIIYDPTAFNWSGDSFSTPPLEDLVIYELHIGTFYDPTPGTGSPGQFANAITKLDYLKGLGVSAVEVMPIAEFPTDVSWGYNPSDPYAVENTGYGGPDGFKTFVKACHTRGLAVLLDVIHNHYGPSDLDLWNFDGWTGGTNGGGVYFYNTSNLCCTTYGSRPNYSRQQVRDYIQDNFRLWLDEYHVDGFRWDTPGLMMNASGYGYVADAGTLIQTITSMIHNSYPGKIDISEDVSGYGFDSKWDTGFPGSMTWQLSQTSDASRDMNTVWSQISGGGAGLTRVVYLESHDVVGDLNGGTRLVAAIDSTTPNSYWARKRSTLGAAVTLTAPSVPMVFQGQEMLENQQFSASRAVDWTKTVTYTNIFRLYRDLTRLRRDLDGVTPGLKGDQCSVYKVDNSNKLLAYRRWKSGADVQDAFIVANFANATRNNYSLTFPRAGNWYVHFNSDSTAYGSDYGNVGPSLVVASGTPATAGVTIGPYSALILSQTPPPTLTISQTNGVVMVAWPLSAVGWVLDTSITLIGNPPPWTQVPTVQYQTNASTIFVTPTPQPGTAFYRLRRL